MNIQDAVDMFSKKVETPLTEEDEDLLRELLKLFGRYIVETVEAYHKAKDEFYDFSV